MTKSEIQKKSNKFEALYGERTLIRANLAAINRMLERRGKSEELYKDISDIMDQFHKKKSEELSSSNSSEEIYG